MGDKLFKAMDDLRLENEEAQKQWLATRRVGEVGYDPQYDIISINIEGLTAYDIEFDRISDAAQFTEWMFHLNEKKWMTGQIYKDLLDCLEWVILEKTGLHSIQFYKVSGRS